MKKEKYSVFSGFSDIQRVYGHHAFFYHVFFVLLFCISLIFLSILAHPIEYTSQEKIKKNGIDIELVLDLSFSMIAEDLSPNRLEVAKQVLIDFIDSRETDRVGLILFAGKPFTSVPLSFDYDFLREYISNISIETIDRNYGQLGGTAIGDGMVLAYDALESQQERNKVIILITDGEANTGVDPIVALKVLKDADIRTYTIGVGGLSDTFIEFVDQLGFRSRLAVGGVDEDTLKKIAIETGGQYYRATSQDALKEIFASISELETTEIEQNTIQIQTDRYQPFLYLLVILFLLLSSIIYHKNIKIS